MLALKIWHGTYCRVVGIWNKDGYVNKAGITFLQPGVLRMELAMAAKLLPVWRAHCDTETSALITTGSTDHHQSGPYSLSLSCYYEWAIYLSTFLDIL